MPTETSPAKGITYGNQPSCKQALDYLAGRLGYEPGYYDWVLSDPGFVFEPEPEPATPEPTTLDHILTDLHEVLRRLAEFEREARPLLNAYKRTNGGTIGLLKARKGMRNGG